MTLDFTTIMALLGPFIPFLLTLFPGLNAILKIVPKAVWEAMVKIVGGAGTTITWAPTVAAQRGALEARQAVLLGRAYNGTADGKDSSELQAVETQLAALPKGTIMDLISSLIGGGGGGMLPILLIVGAVFLLPMIMGGDGCKKKTTEPAAPKAEVVVPASPTGGR